MSIDFVTLLESFVSLFYRSATLAPLVDKDLWRLYRATAGSDSVRPSAQAFLDKRARTV